MMAMRNPYYDGREKTEFQKGNQGGKEKNQDKLQKSFKDNVETKEVEIQMGKQEIEGKGVMVIKREKSSRSVSMESKICPICNKIFRKVSKKKYHMLIHTKLFKNLRIDDKMYWSEDKTTLSCRDCGKEFNKQINMKVHIARVHYQLHNLEPLNTIESSDISRRVEEIKSAIKLEISSDHNPKAKKVKLTVHEIQKQADFKCKKCNEIFFTGRKLQFHKKTHINTNPFKCILCDKRLLNPTTLIKQTRIFRKDVVDLPAQRKHVISYDKCENPQCEEINYKYTSVHVANTSECIEYYEGVYKKSIAEIFDQKRKDKVKARWIKPKGYYKKVGSLDILGRTEKQDCDKK